MAVNNLDSLPANFRIEAQTNLTSDKFSQYALFFCLICAVLQIGLILINWSKFPPQVPIFYSRPWGEQMLASPLFLLTLPALGIIFGAVNFAISLFFLQEHFFAKRVLIVFSAVIAFATLYNLGRIVGLLV